MGRAPCCDKSKVKRGPWSPEEDATLKTYLEKHGTVTNWIALPHKAGLNRCGKSCRLRWLNYLRPDIKHGGFTEEEDNVIWTLYSTIGSRWSVIASQLPGRTDNDVKNYWNTKLKKKLLASGGTSNFNHNTNANNTNTTKISSEGDKLGRFSGLISKVIEASDHHQWNSANCFIDPNLGANYGKIFPGPQLEQNRDHFDPINIGQFSSHQPISPDHVEVFDFGANGNTSSSNNISSTLEVSNSSCLSSSPTALGFDNNLASWSGNINSNYINGGVNSSTGDQDHEFLMEYLGFGSSNDHVLLSGFGF